MAATDERLKELAAERREIELEHARECGELSGGGENAVSSPLFLQRRSTNSVRAVRQERSVELKGTWALREERARLGILPESAAITVVRDSAQEEDAGLARGTAKIDSTELRSTVSRMAHFHQEVDNLLGRSRPICPSARRSSKRFEGEHPEVARELRRRAANQGGRVEQDSTSAHGRVWTFPKSAVLQRVETDLRNLRSHYSRSSGFGSGSGSKHKRVPASSSCSDVASRDGSAETSSLFCAAFGHDVKESDTDDQSQPWAMHKEAELQRVERELGQHLSWDESVENLPTLDSQGVGVWDGLRTCLDQVAGEKRGEVDLGDTHEHDSIAEPLPPAAPRVVYLCRRHRDEGGGGGAEVRGEGGGQLEAVFPLPPDPDGRHRAIEDLVAVAVAVGQEAQLRSVKLSASHVWLVGGPDNVQYAQDLLEAALLKIQ